MSGGRAPAQVVLAAALAAGGPVTLPHRLCLALAEAVGVDGAAIAALTDTPLRQALGASDDLAQLLETVQFTTGEGPCVQAAATGHPVIVPDLHTQAHTRWPFFAAVAARRLRDIGAVFAFPLRFDDTTLGSVNLYNRTPRTLNRIEITEAGEAISVVAIALVTTLERIDNEPSPSGADPWRSMHLAIGVIAGQLDAVPRDALAHMRAYAFTHDVLLSDLADAVLAHQLDAADLQR